MELTGTLYGFYSDISILEVFNKLNDFAETLGYKMKKDLFQEWQNIFFYKDEVMLMHHDERGYNTDLNNEGCFNIEAKKTRLNGIATLIEFEGASNFQPLDINLAINQIFYYILTVPFAEDEDKFSKKIHHAFQDILTCT